MRDACGKAPPRLRHAGLGRLRGARVSEIRHLRRGQHPGLAPALRDAHAPDPGAPRAPRRAAPARDQAPARVGHARRSRMPRTARGPRSPTPRAWEAPTRSELRVTWRRLRCHRLPVYFRMLLVGYFENVGMRPIVTDPTTRPEAPALARRHDGVHVTGHGTTFQTAEAYSAMVRSLEKRPDPATFRIAMRVQASASEYRSPTRPLAST